MSRRTEPATGPAGAASGTTPRTVAVIDIGASAIRMAVAEIADDGDITRLEEASRGVLLGKDTFTHGRITPETLDAALRALTGFRRIMDDYGVQEVRAVATSAVREASNRDNFLDRVRLRTGLDVEIIDGSEENRLTYLAVSEVLAGHEALKLGHAILAEVGGGSADISFLQSGEPVFSGTYALGSIRMRQSVASWHGSEDRRLRLLSRHIHNVVDDIRREMPLKEATHMIGLGGDLRFAAERIQGDPDPDLTVRTIGRAEFMNFCDELAGLGLDAVRERYRLPQTEAETLVPALLVYRELLVETSAEQITVPRVSLRAGLLLDLSRRDGTRGIADLARQVLASAAALGEKYRYDESHAMNVAHVAVRLFDELREEHGLSERDRLILEVAAMLHDIGIFIGLRGHHKHAQYILSSSEIFGLTRDDMAVVGAVARYHRRAMPQRSHAAFAALDRRARVTVNKLAAILRVANALDADHLQKVWDVHVLREDDAWVLEVEGAGDLTMERLSTQARSDLFADVFGRSLAFRVIEGKR